MTSAPVKNVNSLMNFVGGKTLTKTGGTPQTGSFGDVMSKTQSGGSNGHNQTVANKETGKTPKTDVMRSRKEAVKPREASLEKEDAANMVQPEEMTEDQTQAVETAGNEIVKEIAGKFDVPEEEVEKAMEMLGLSICSLFDPAKLTQLVLQLEGSQDAAVLLTDESLFSNLQDVISIAADRKADLGRELEMAPEEMQALLEGLQTNLDQQWEAGEGSAEKITVDTEQDPEDAVQMAEEKGPQITVEVKTGGESVKLLADEKGNVTGTVEAVPLETEGNVTNDHAREHEQKGNERGRKESEGALHTGNLQLDAFAQNKTQIAEVSFEQTAEVFSEQTREIMDQIMDYMKIQLKPGMDQLEMQLHPESLGTVHIQLSSKGGEVTAQFHVQNETVKAAIESQMVSLQESLKEQGIKVEAVQVTVESHGFESNLWQGQEREENASSRESRKSPRRINLNDLSGLNEEEASEEELLAAKMMEANGNTVDYTA